MTTTPTAPTAPLLRRYLLSTVAWRLAGSTAITQLSAASGTDLTPLRDEGVEAYLSRQDPATLAGAWDELTAEGLATTPGRLADPWAAAIIEAAQPQVGIRLVSGYQDVAGVADVSISGDRAMSVMQRRLTHDAARGGPVEAEDTVVEVALFGTAHLWPAVQRLLPPVPALRAEPELTAYGDRTAHALDVATQEQYLDALYAAPLLESPGAVLAGLDLKESAPAFADAFDPTASVSLVVAARPADGRPPALAIRSWILGDEQLYAVQSRPEVGPVLLEVEPGAIGFDLVWFVTGAAEYLGATSAGAPR